MEVERAQESRAPLETVRLSKSYAGHRVLHEVDFKIRAGESVAIIGENGAGKSTFAKIVAGVVRPDEGEVRLGDVPVFFHSPREAWEQGIGFIPQELAYVPRMTVAENILLGRWPSWKGITSQTMVRRRAREEAGRFGLEVDFDRPMNILKMADRQLVEILKILVRDVRLIILDEPTSALSEHESQTLFGVLRSLTSEGVAVIYISHRMDEVYKFSDRVTVLRDGRLVFSSETRKTTHDQLIGHMLGRPREELEGGTLLVAAAGPVISLRNLHREGGLRHVSIDVAAGEILGIFGVRGAGGELIAEALGGCHRDVDGEISIDGKVMRVFRNPRLSRRAGVAYVPQDRKREGLVPTLSVQQNVGLFLLRLLSRLGVVRQRVERRIASKVAQEFDIRARSLSQKVAQLSGGNQQKTLLATRLSRQPKVLILHEPTRGVDVGARLQIHRFLRRLARQGIPIMVATADVEEAIAVSDRVVIVRDGEIVEEIRGEDKTQSRALQAAVGHRARTAS
jgi:ribose transport system ATP-binding protein